MPWSPALLWPLSKDKAATLRRFQPLSLPETQTQNQPDSSALSHCILSHWKRLSPRKQASKYQQPQLPCWQWITNQSLQLICCHKVVPNFLTSSGMLLRAGPALKPWWSVASSGQANSSCHQPALNPGPNSVYWSMTSLSVGSSDFLAKKNIWLVSDWSLECKQFYLQRGWRVEPCPRAEQGVNQPDSTETPSEIYFHFWPIFSCELISSCHTSCNLGQDSKFLHF